MRYDLDKQNSEYFNLEGENVKKAFLRSPVKLSYISSKYNLKRRHPVLHTIRAHRGVDYAANKGSPIRATGDGTVLFAEYNAGCGNEMTSKRLSLCPVCKLNKKSAGKWKRKERTPEKS